MILESNNGVVEDFPTVIPPIEVYTDGSCNDETKIGAWAWVLPFHGSATGYEETDDSARMELRAVVEAIASHEGKLVVVTDYRIIMECFKKNWWKKWELNNWGEHTKRPVANRDLWERIIERYKQGGLEIIWVDKSTRSPGNLLADALAKQTRKEREEGLA